jgi:cell division initiation protein
MKLTPLDIRKQEFRKTLRGFDPIEVQTFLEMVGEEYEQVLEKNKLLNNRLIELETKLKNYQETEKNLRETLLNVQEVKKQSEESSRKQADLVVKEAELKALEIIEIARKQARKMRDEVNLLRTQKESFINRLRQILISQIELLSVLEIDEALPEEAFKFLENVRSRKKIALARQTENQIVESNPDEMEDEENPVDIEYSEEEKKQSQDQKIPEKITQEKEQETKKTDDENKVEADSTDKRRQKPSEKSEQKKVDDEINEFFKKEIQIDELMKDLHKKSKREK